MILQRLFKYFPIVLWKIMTDSETLGLCSLFSQHKQDEKIKFCDLCLRKNLRRKQTHFCKTCDVPEALCKDCAQQHTRNRVSRHHEICEDAGKLQSFKQ